MNVVEYADEPHQLQNIKLLPITYDLADNYSEKEKNK